MGAVHSGQNNTELVDNLMKFRYIKTKVELLFRAVDRADYILPEFHKSAYEDIAWKQGNIHLSSPCIYSVVMESLCLEPGLSFLNLGSGTGYLNTMVGLALGRYGINHGIEIYDDCIAYAYDRLDDFHENSLAVDQFDFCNPIFVQGNCLNFAPTKQYDRVYCGAACGERQQEFIKQFVKVGGILVMPFEDILLRLKRIDENKWEQEKILSVSFSSMILPTDNQILYLPECNPLSLKEICRGAIVNHLRKNVWIEHPDLETKKEISVDSAFEHLLPAPLPISNRRRPAIPMSEDNTGDEDEEFGTTNESTEVNNQYGEASSASGGKTLQNQEENRTDLTKDDDESGGAKSLISNSDTDSDMDNNGVKCKKLGEENKRGSDQINDFNQSNTSDTSDTEDNNDDPIQPKTAVEHEEETDDSDMTEDDEEDNAYPDLQNRLDGFLCFPFGQISTLFDDDPIRMLDKENQAVGHYVDAYRLSYYLKQKINQLTLPRNLKIFLNHSRNL
ncbi:protein-L-isoaspartate O-methyltransferase domain-containing protein 1-like [Prorops nasuta]|uniref:protein-L-isoaspartate O-methyltransferase domain-containing protein 1-like n=1 Tax=Prorops nasuta TaxID=863751 RepID=UPI0034CD716A